MSSEENKEILARNNYRKPTIRTRSNKHIRTVRNAFPPFATFAARSKITPTSKGNQVYATQSTEESAGRRATQDGTYFRDGLTQSQLARHPPHTGGRAQFDATQDHHRDRFGTAAEQHTATGGAGADEDQGPHVQEHAGGAYARVLPGFRQYAERVLRRYDRHWGAGRADAIRGGMVLGRADRDL